MTSLCPECMMPSMRHQNNTAFCRHCGTIHHISIWSPPRPTSEYIYGPYAGKHAPPAKKRGGEMLVTGARGPLEGLLPQTPAPPTISSYKGKLIATVPRRRHNIIVPVSYPQRRSNRRRTTATPDDIGSSSRSTTETPDYVIDEVGMEMKREE